MQFWKYSWILIILYFNQLMGLYAQLYTDTEVDTDKEWNIPQEIYI